MYKNFIAIGWFCGTPASLSRYGLRNCRGPFDWYVSNFESVIHFMETDFIDFLSKENLEAAPKEFDWYVDNETVVYYKNEITQEFIQKNNLRLSSGHKNFFIDKKYNLVYNHDTEIIAEFESEFPKIYSKYMEKELKDLEKQITEPTCFVRAVKDQKEIDFINNNFEYINSVIKRENKESDLLLLIPSNLKINDNVPFIWFNLNFEKYRVKDLRNIFDYNPNILNFLQSNISSMETVYKNIIFDREKEIKRLSIIEKRFKLSNKLENKTLDFNKIPNEFAIYGLGKNGKHFYNLCKDKYKIECFIDKKPKFPLFEDIPVLHVNQAEQIKSKNIIVIPTYDIDKIEIQISNNCIEKKNLILLDDLFV